MGLPAIPRRYLPLPTIVQFFVLVLLTLQAKSFIFSSPEYTPPNPEPTSGVDRTITIVFLLICLEGLCGGSAYVNTFYHVGQEGDTDEDIDNGSPEEQKRKMEKEFRIGATGAADSCGKLPVSVLSADNQVSSSRRSSRCRSRSRFVTRRCSKGGTLVARYRNLLYYQMHLQVISTQAPQVPQAAPLLPSSVGTEEGGTNPSSVHTAVMFSGGVRS